MSGESILQKSNFKEAIASPRTNKALAIFKKELLAYFYSPLGYLSLILFVFASGYLTFEAGRGSFFHIRQASLVPFFSNLPWIFLFLIPAVCMKTWSEEFRSGTRELLLTLPLKTSEIILGKFLACWAFLAIGLSLTFPMILTVIYLGSPDISVLASGYLVTFFMGGTLIAICNFFSVFSSNQVISYSLSFVGCLVLLMAGSPPVLEYILHISPRYFVDLIESLSILARFENGIRGVWLLSDLFFWMATTLFWLAACAFAVRESRG